MQSTSLRSLSFKTTLLLALASVKRVGDLQALSVNPACLEFGPNDSKIVLKPRLGYVPKLLSTPFRAQVIALSALSPSMDDQELYLLCPVRALKVYIERSASYRRSEQLFVGFGNRAKGRPVVTWPQNREIVFISDIPIISNIANNAVIVVCLYFVMVIYICILF